MPHILVTSQVSFRHIFNFPVPHRSIPPLRLKLCAIDKFVFFTSTSTTNVLCCSDRIVFFLIGLLRRRAPPVGPNDPGFSPAKEKGLIQEEHPVKEPKAPTIEVPVPINRQVLKLQAFTPFPEVP